MIDYMGPKPEVVPCDIISGPERKSMELKSAGLLSLLG